MSGAEDKLDRAERIAGELRAATAEAAGVLKDLTAAIRRARAQVDEYAAHEVERVMKLHLDTCQAAVDQWYKDMVANVNQINERFTVAEGQMTERLARTFTVPLDQARKFEELLNTMPHVEVHTRVIRE